MSGPYRHPEAFCQMQYACKACGFQEVIWNSRDGVTPFCLQCPQCHGLDETHVNWQQDRCVPDYIPTPGQRIFVDLPRELAREMVIEYMKRNRSRGWDLPPEGTAEWESKVEALTDDWYKDGRAPHVTEAD